MKKSAENAISTERNLLALFLLDKVLPNLVLALRRLFRKDCLTDGLADLISWSWLLSDDNCNTCDLRWPDLNRHKM